MFRKNNIKLMFIISGVILLLFMVLFFTHELILVKVKQNTLEKFIEINKKYQNQQQHQINELNKFFNVMGKDKNLSRFIDLNRGDSLKKHIEPYIQSYRFDMYAVFNTAWNHVSGTMIDSHSIDKIKNGLNEKHKLIDDQWTGYLNHKLNLYWVCVSPIYSKSNFFGIILIGRKINQKKLIDIKNESDIDISLFYDFNILNSTNKNMNPTYYSKLFDKHRPIFDAVMMTRQASQIFKTQLNSVEVFSLLMPDKQNNQILILTTIPVTWIVNIFFNIQKYNIIISTFLTLLFISYVILLGRVLIIRSRNNQFLKQEKSFQSDRKIEFSYPNDEPIEIGVLISHYNPNFKLHNKYDNKTLNLTDILNLQSQIIELYDGNFIKYADGINVGIFYGKNPVEKAVECAITMQRIMKRENPNNISPLSIGINMGKMIVKDSKDNKHESLILNSPLTSRCLELCNCANNGEILLRNELLNQLNHRYKTGKIQKMIFTGNLKEIEIIEICAEKNNSISTS